MCYTQQTAFLYLMHCVFYIQAGGDHDLSARTEAAQSLASLMRVPGIETLNIAGKAKQGWWMREIVAFQFSLIVLEREDIVLSHKKLNHIVLQNSRSALVVDWFSFVRSKHSSVYKLKEVFSKSVLGTYRGFGVSIFICT